MKIGLALKQEIEATFQIVSYRTTTDELCFICPEPGCGDRTGNRSVNLKTGLTGCWRCPKDKAGNFITWAARLGYHFTAEGSGEGGIIKELEDEPAAKLLPPVQPVELPKGFVLLADERKSVYTRLITEMAERKHLTFDDLAAVHCGFTRIDPKWEEYAIFPVIEYGVIVYWQGRTYIDKPGEPTKLFPSRSEIKYGARYWVYNIDELRQKKASIVLVVESVLNVLSLRWKLAELGWNTVVPVAVFKSGVSTEQWLKITRCPHVKEVCLLFDHDAVGKAWDSSRMLSNRVTLSIAEMPAGPDNSKLDPNDNVETAIDVFEKRSLYTVSTSLEKKLNDSHQPSVAGLRVRS